MTPLFRGLAALTAFTCITISAQTHAQAQAQWIAQSSGVTESLRGLSVVSDRVVWASGTHGTYLWTDDGGTVWHHAQVPNTTSWDFRAVHAVSLDTVYLMVAMQDTARIYKTTDRGTTWNMQYDDMRPGAFLDAMAFFTPSHGLALGDPMNERFVMLQTNDGMQWTPSNARQLPAGLPSEAAFAASGTCLIAFGERFAWFATGGATVSRVFRTGNGGISWTVAETPVVAGASSRGIFSLAFQDTLRGVAVGGDYAKPDPTATTVAVTSDGGHTWRAASPSPATGYLSAVAYLPNTEGRQLIAVGTQGTARSMDGGMTWIRSDANALNALSCAPTIKNGYRCWAVGPKGAIMTTESMSP